MQDSQAPLPSDADNCRIDKRNMPMRKLSRCRGRIESTRLAVDGIRARGRTAWLLLTGPCEARGGRSQRPFPALNDDRGNYRVLHCVYSVCIRIRFDRWAYTETCGCGSASVEQCRSGVRGWAWMCKVWGGRGMRERKIAERIKCFGGKNELKNHCRWG